MSEDIFERIEALRSSLSELEHHVGGVLRRSAASQRYQDFVRSSSDWAWETDENLNYSFVSEGIAATFGVAARVMLGRYLFSLNHFREVDDTLLATVDLIQERRSFRDVELHPVDSEGTHRRVLLSGVPAFDDVGKFIGYRGTGLDLTRRSRAAAEAEPAASSESDRRLDQALDAGGVGIWDWALPTGDLYVAPRLKGMLGYRNRELAANIEAWREHVHPEDRDRLQQAIDAHLQGQTPEVDLEYRMQEREGGTRWLHFRARASRAATGEAERLTGTCTDITVQKETETKLRQATERAESANRAKTDFLAHLSHELRTPLNAIIGFSEAIKSGYLGPLTVEKSREYASDVHAASMHLLELINDVLDLSKVEAGEVRLADETINLAEAIHGSVRLVEGRAAAERLRLNVDIASDVPRLRVDPRLFRQVLLNLLTNAIKFTHARGVITARARYRDDGGVTVEVSDTGIGMAEEDIADALTPFRQVGEDADRREEGTGLGLPIAKSLVELHGGTLRIDSREGVGTTVIIAFPADRSVR